MSKKVRKGKYSNAKKTRVVKPQVTKTPAKVQSSSDSYFDKYPRWLFQRFDFEHKKWGMECNSKELSKIFRYLSNLENRKWRDILLDKSGRRNNTRNHYIEISDLSNEAKKRSEEIRIDEFDELCSIAVSGQCRVWGFIIDGLFYIVWLDPKHEVYPVRKKHT